VDATADHSRREQVERITLRIVGCCFLALAAYILYESGSTLLGHKAPERSIPGIIVAAISVVVMPEHHLEPSERSWGLCALSVAILERSLHSDAPNLDNRTIQCPGEDPAAESSSSASAFFSSPDSSCDNVIPRALEIRTRLLKLRFDSPRSTLPTNVRWSLCEHSWNALTVDCALF